MTFVNMTIKGLNKEMYREIKSIAAQEDVRVAHIVNEGMAKAIKARKHKVKKLDKNDPFFNLITFPVDCGVDTDVINADRYIYQ